MARLIIADELDSLLVFSASLDSVGLTPEIEPVVTYWKKFALLLRGHRPWQFDYPNKWEPVKRERWGNLPKKIHLELITVVIERLNAQLIISQELERQNTLLNKDNSSMEKVLQDLEQVR
ncbi:MAG: hypothetical protein HQK83_12425 [Fibrobacteria bacterium]|nr:hypothetical protein [Fibrobacteria bacterium]